MIERFPVGRRLAFDADKGRLWAICVRCHKWNLTPIEERWEAIEACEKAFRATRLRMSTSEIGLARVSEGLELVRIGTPLRPEMAAWRYGDQFGRRRRRLWYAYASTLVGTAGYVVAGPALGLVSFGAFPLWSIANSAYTIYNLRRSLVRVRASDGTLLGISALGVAKTTIRWDVRSQDWFLDIHHQGQAPAARRVFDAAFSVYKLDVATLDGESARRAARQILPAINLHGASKEQVDRAVAWLEKDRDPQNLFGRAARHYGAGTPAEGSAIGALPAGLRLALEMAINEDTERRALEGELHLLESAWRGAEEIAGIADNLLLPAAVETDLKRLKHDRDAGPR